MPLIQFPKKTTVGTDVTIPDLVDCDWSIYEDALMLSTAGVIIGWVNSSKELHMFCKNIPDAMNMKNVSGALVDAYKAMKQANIW